MSENLWNSLEIAKLFFSIFTPVSVVVLGWFINRRLKRLDQIQWSNQVLIEKRLSLYDKLSPLLNKLYCFYTWVGYWRDVSSDDVIKAKRDLDKDVNIYRHLLGEDFINEYQSFIKLLFKEGRGPDHKPEITRERQKIDEIKKKYFKLMNIFKNSIGIS